MQLAEDVLRGHRAFTNSQATRIECGAPVLSRYVRQIVTAYEDDVVVEKALTHGNFQRDISPTAQQTSNCPSERANLHRSWAPLDAVAHDLLLG